MPRQAIVTFGGRSEDGGEHFHMSFDAGEPGTDRQRPTANQAAAIADFYGFEVEDESELQAHVLLTIRDYSRLAASAISSRSGRDRRLLIARMIAAFVSQDSDRRRHVARWADDRWRRAADPDRAMRGIRRTKHYSAVEAFVADAIADMRDAGALDL